jgi:hypothetical protein
MMTKTLLTKSLFFLLLFFFHHHNVNAQSIIAKIIDSQSAQPISYANILIDNEVSLVSNDEGLFNVNTTNPNSTIIVSYLGFVDKVLTVQELQTLNNTIALVPAAIELNELNVNTKKLTPTEIMTNVRANLTTNYAPNGTDKHNKIFMRESNFTKPKKVEVEITKSTGFSKEGLKKTNAKLTSFSNFIIKNNPKSFKDVLFDVYTGKTTNKENKQVNAIKYSVQKATLLKNENSGTNQDEIQNEFINIILTHLDTTKYYRIKSGLFGSKDTLTLNNSHKKKSQTKKQENPNLNNLKANYANFLIENSINNNTKFSFIHNPDWYQYKLEGLKYTNTYDFVYVLSFKPKKGKALYQGKLYISDADFAVLRADYTFADGKRGDGINLKLLLGVKTFETVENGTLIYKKNPTDKGYYLQYGSKETGQYMYLNRPLKFIEITNEDKDVVAFDLKFESDIFEKTEFVNISREEGENEVFSALKETEFNYQTLKKYDASIWINYTTLEPLEEMKQFKAVEFLD